jgi:hypothetical protein
MNKCAPTANAHPIDSNFASEVGSVLARPRYGGFFCPPYNLPAVHSLSNTTSPDHDDSDYRTNQKQNSNGDTNGTQLDHCVLRQVA